MSYSEDFPYVAVFHRHTHPLGSWRDITSYVVDFEVRDAGLKKPPQLTLRLHNNNGNLTSGSDAIYQNDQIYVIANVDYGNKYIVGGFANTLTLGSNSLTCETGDIFVAKMDTNDNWLWAVQGGESVHAINIDLVIDNLNNIFVAGDFWDIATFGNSSLISNGDRDIFVVRCGQYFSDFIADITLGYIPLTVNFSDLSANNPTAWEWDFNYDGIIDSYEQHPTYIYSQSGIYTVLLTVSDGTNTDTKINTNYITVVDAFTADFEADITSGLQPLEVQFTDLSLIDPTNWEWDFDNDGTIDSYEQNPIYLFLPILHNHMHQGGSLSNISVLHIKIFHL